MTFAPPPQVSPAPTSTRSPRLTVTLVILGTIEGLVALFALYAFCMTAVQLVVGPINTTPANPALAKYTAEVFWASLPQLVVPLQFFQMLLSGAILYLVVQVFRGVVEHRPRLMVALLVAAAFSTLKFLFQAFTQYRVFQRLSGMMDAVLSPGAPPPPGFESIMSTVMVASVVASYVFAVLILSAKLFLYFFTRATLKRTERLAQGVAG